MSRRLISWSWTGTLICAVFYVCQGLCAIVWSLGILPSAIALTSLPPYSDEEEDMLFDEFLEYDAHKSGGNHEQAKVCVSEAAFVCSARCG